MAWDTVCGQYMESQIAKFMGPNMGPTWVLLAPNGPHVDPMSFAIRSIMSLVSWESNTFRIHHRKVHVAHMGPTWFLSAPGRPHVGPMKPAIWVVIMVSVVLILWTNCVTRHNADWGTYLLSAFSWLLMTCVDVNCVDGMISFKISDKIFWYPVALTECLQCTYLLFNGEYIQ